MTQCLGPVSDASLTPEYRQRLTARQGDLAARERDHVRVSRLRLAIVAAAGLMTWRWGFGAGWWYALPVVVFVAVAVLHAKLLDRRDRASRAVQFYGRGLERLTHDWMGRGDAGDRYRQDNHLFADDVDLFGRGSAYELLATSRTISGRDTLARWLLTPAPPDVARARQAAVQELTPRLDLRERLAVEGEQADADVHAGRLRAWAAAPIRLQNAPARLAFLVLSIGIASIFVLWAAQGGLTRGTAIGLAALLLVEGALALWYDVRVRESIRGIVSQASDLSLLAGVLRIIEDEPCTSPELARIQAALSRSHRPASQEIARLNQLVALLESRTNIIFALPALLLAWTSQMAFAIEAWRARVGSDVPRWLDAIGEFEALTALAMFAAEHPAYAFPELAEGPAIVHAAAMAHPLLPDDAVSNDIAIGGEAPHLFVLSGSNMSGKSTFLRALGLNVVLARAGAPVRATRFRLAPVELGASIRVLDSLQDGKSRFFAEILRLKQIVELSRAEPGRVLFLLDEILAGTNSHDRRRGAEAVLTGLLELGAIGLVTTHDLALGEIADRLSPRAANVHLADVFDGGGLSFDYRLRSGVVKTSNALALMRSIGLDVRSEEA